MVKLDALETLIEAIDGALTLQLEAYDEVESARNALEQARTVLRVAVEDFEYWRTTNDLQVVFLPKHVRLD